MFWFDRQDSRAIFADKRRETHVLPDVSSRGGSRTLEVNPDVIEGDWREMLRRGFAECFRVLRPEGTLIFKWNEHEVPVSQILALTPERPLVGQRCGKTAKTHWMVFMKPNDKLSHGGDNAQ
jgi:hypothetical protein